MMANHKDREVPFNGKIVIVKKGSRITSLHKLSERWHWSIHKVSDFLNLLEEAGMITQERNSQGTPKEHRGDSQGTLAELNNTLEVII